MRLFTKIRKVVTKQNRPSIPFTEWNGLFCLLSDRLTTLLRGTEEKFLSIGSRLQDFSARAKKLSEMSASVASLTSGTHIDGTIEKLHEQLDTMIEYLNLSGNESGGSVKSLQNILGITEGFSAVCNGFRQIALVLQFLSTTTQIENARFGKQDTGFNILSDDVKKLALLINTKATNIQNNSVSLSLLVRDVLSRTRELSKQQQSSASSILKDTQANLESLTILSKKSVEVLEHIAQNTAAICRNINDVVTSMQFQDITRQQLEHVKKVLECLRDRLVFDEHGNGTINDRDFVGEIGDICEIQSSQLFQTRDIFVHAVDSVIENLQGISKRVMEIVQTTKAISGDTHQSNTSYLSQIGGGIDIIIQSLRENVKRGKEISSSVSSAVHGMTEFVKDIEEIGAEIELIAFNAQVKSKRIGDEGKTLGTLATEIQRLAMDAEGQTAVVLEKLKAIANEAKIFHGSNDSPSGSSEDEANAVIERLNNLQSTIQKMNAECVSLLNQITEDGLVLGEEIEMLSHQIVFHRENAQIIEEITTGLVEMMTHSRELVSQPLRKVKSVSLESIDNSAMQYTGEIPCPATVSLTGYTGNNASSTKDNEAVGENVELF